MKFDLHIHSLYSDDCSTEISKIIKVAKERNLDGIAITDHNTIQGSLKALELVRNDKNFIIIPGIEISSSEGHILAYGIKENIPRDLSAVETCDKIVAFGGVPVAAHPFRRINGLSEMSIINAKFIAIETMNARSSEKTNQRALNLKNRLNLPATGGSDDHEGYTIGYAYMETNENLSNMENVLDYIRKGLSTGSGQQRDIKSMFNYARRSLNSWMNRGFKRV